MHKRGEKVSFYKQWRRRTESLMVWKRAVATRVLERRQRNSIKSKRMRGKWGEDADEEEKTRKDKGACKRNQNCIFMQTERERQKERMRWRVREMEW